MLIKRWVRMDQAGSEGAASGSAEGGAAGAEDKGAASAQAEGSLLDELNAGQGEGGEGEGAADTGKEADTPEARALKAAEKDTRRPKGVPSKFWNAEKGEVNYDAWSASTKQLEARMKDVGLPPESADGYKYEAPPEIKALGVDLDPDVTKELREEALKNGLSQKQFEWVMGKYFASLEDFISHGERYDKAKTLQALTEHYKTPDAIQQNVKAAYDVFSAYADEDEMKDMYRVVNDPVMIRVLAKINKELQEDPGVSPEAILSGESVDDLMAKGSPYWDSTHPQHQRTKEKVAAHFAAQTKAAARKRAA